MPENIHAIRALTAIETDGATSIAMTDRALGLAAQLVPASAAVMLVLARAA